MQIDKDQILNLLRSQGRNDDADAAANELPDSVDTDNTEHAGVLSRFGLDPAELQDKLGGLGKFL